MLLVSVSIVVRIYYVTNLMEDVTISEEIYQTARQGADLETITNTLSEGLNIKSLYLCSLYAMFSLFGNFTVAGVYLNMVYQVLAVMLLFVAVNNISNRDIAFGTSLVVCVFPLYVKQIGHVTALDLAIVFGALILVGVTGILRVFLIRRKSKRNTKEYARPVEPPEVFVVQAQGQQNAPVIDTSLREIRLDDLEEKKVQYIENPLPIPKRKEHREMNFAVEVTPAQEDYDLKDLEGKDFFDIE